MSGMHSSGRESELEAIRRELDEAKAVIVALHRGEADSIVVDTNDGPKVYTLRSADEPYRTLVETLKEGAVTVSQDGVVLYCNEAFSRLVGRDSSTLIGRSLDEEIADGLMAKIRSNSGSSSFECSLTRNDGSHRECLISSVPHQTDGQTIWCLLVTDLTGQALRLRHNAIIESTDDAVISFDIEGRIATWNPAAEALFGYDAAEAIGQDASLLVEPLDKIPDGETRRGAFDAALAGHKVQKDTQRVAKDGTVIDVSVTASPIRAPDGTITGVSAIMRDIRARKQAEARFASIREALSAEVDAGRGVAALPETTAYLQTSHNDPRRLELVIGAGLLDAPREKALDQLTRLAASILQAPMALITVIDHERQFFVSSHGLAEPVRSARETPLWTSYCRHVIESGAAVVIADAEHNPLVCDIGAWKDGFVAYLGVPIRHRDGNVIASLSVADSRPRAWTERELLTLQGISRLLVNEIDNRTVLRDLAESERRVRESEQRLRYSLQAAHAGAWEWDVRSGKVTWSPENYRLHDIEPSPDGPTYAGWEARVHPDDIQPTTQHIRDVMDGSAAEFRTEFRIVHRDGAIRWLAGMGQVERASDGTPVRMLGINIDITERKQAEAALRAAHDTFRHLVERSPFGIYTVNADFRLVQVSAGAQKVFENVPRPIGRDFAEVIRAIWPEPFSNEVIARFRHTLETGEPYHSTSMVKHRADVETIEAYDWKIERITLPDGRPGVVCHFYDLSERQRHEEHERLLMREVNHRAKNVLSLVQAIARQTAAANSQDFVERFAQRIQALSASQDVLVKSGWRNVPLRALMCAQLGHFVDLIGRRIILSGPPLQITAAAAQAIGLALHELATNAAKYGSLSAPSGTVTVTWNVVANGRGSHFTLWWREAGGPPVMKPERTGFGSTVTGSLVKMSLEGEVDTEFAPSGLTWKLTCPTHKVVEGIRQGARLQTGKADLGVGLLDRPRVLVVEDEPLIAMEIADTLDKGGFQVVGPVGSVEQALLAIGQGKCDGAVLDVNLGEETAEPIADKLTRCGTPFVTVTGYTRDQMSAAFRKAPLVGKPVRPDRLLAVLRQCMASALAS